MRGYKELTAKEKRFCAKYLDCGNAAEAAREAGIGSGAGAEKLLGDSRITGEIKRLSQLRTELLEELAYTGYLRLAFGKISDAVRLVFGPQPSQEEIENMDLFSVAEIRRPKDGSVEIKFADRLKALEKLEQAIPDKTEGQVSFYDALMRAAEAVEKSGSGGNENGTV